MIELVFAKPVVKFRAIDKRARYAQVNPLTVFVVRFPIRFISGSRVLKPSANKGTILRIDLIVYNPKHEETHANSGVLRTVFHCG